jgi:hypothetical protein
VYAKAGKRLSAAIIDHQRAVIDHKAYWYTIQEISEGHYLVAILNSEIVRKAIEPQQTRGEFNPRDVDKLVWGLPIPLYDAKIKLHREIAEAGLKAESLANEVSLEESSHFTKKRKTIRDALISNGISKKIEILVERLLAG